MYTAIDIQNNIAESFFTVTVLDIEPPLISDMPADMVLTNDVALCGAVVAWDTPRVGGSSDDSSPGDDDTGIGDDDSASPCSKTCGDVDGNGVVNGGDLGYLLNLWTG